MKNFMQCEWLRRGFALALALVLMGTTVPSVHAAETENSPVLCTTEGCLNNGVAEDGGAHIYCNVEGCEQKTTGVHTHDSAPALCAEEGCLNNGKTADEGNHVFCETEGCEKKANLAHSAAECFVTCTQCDQNALDGHTHPVECTDENCLMKGQTHAGSHQYCNEETCEKKFTEAHSHENDADAPAACDTEGCVLTGEHEQHQYCNTEGCLIKFDEAHTAEECFQSEPCTKTEGCEMQNGHDGPCSGDSLFDTNNISLTENDVTISEAGSYTVTAGGSHSLIINASGKDVTVTLSGIEVTAGANASAVSIEAGNVTLNIEGNVSMTGGNNGAGIYVAEGASVTIQGSGSLTAIGNAGKDDDDHGGGAGIGGTAANGNSGTIVIDGVTVTAKGYGVHGSGIGSGSEGGNVKGTITIQNGAKVTAYGGYYSEGGKLPAGDIYGDSAPEGGAAIGGGGKTSSTVAAITIKNSTVTAYGGSKSAGIGASFWCSCALIDIDDSTITAYGGVSSAGIGTSRAGNNGVSATIQIDNSTVNATGGDHGSGIGGGYNANSLANLPEISITINGGKIVAAGSNGGAGIGGGYKTNNLNISIGGNAEITATAGVLNDGKDKTIDQTCASGIGSGANGSSTFIGSTIEIADTAKITVNTREGGKAAIEGTENAQVPANVSITIETSGTIGQGSILNEASASGITGAITNLSVKGDVLVKLYAGDTLLATSTLKEEGRTKTKLNYEILSSGESDYWTTKWEEDQPYSRTLPTKAVLIINNEEMSQAEVSVDAESWAALKGMNYPVYIGDQGYATLSAAVAAANASTGTDAITITLLDDVNETATVRIEKNVTINGNGRTLTNTDTDNGAAIRVGAGASEVTIQNLHVKGVDYGINYFGTGTLNLDKVTTSGQRYTGVYLVDDGTVNITNGSNISGYGAVYALAGTVHIDGSTINGVNVHTGYEPNGYRALVAGGKATFNVTNSTINAHAEAGAFMDVLGFDHHQNPHDVVFNISADSKLTTSGEGTTGLFDVEGDFSSYTVIVPAEYADQLASEGFTTGAYEADNTGRITITGVMSGPAIAKDNDGNYYASLAEIFAQDGTYTLLTDVHEETITAENTRNVSLNLNNKTIHTSGIMNNGTLKLSNGSIVDTTFDNSGIETTVSLTLENVNVTSARHAIRASGGDTIITGGIFQITTASGSTGHCINVGGDGVAANVTINDGTFTARNNSVEASCVINAQSMANVIIKDGSFSKSVQNLLKCASDATIAISGGSFDKDPTAFLDDGYCVKAEGSNFVVGEHQLEKTEGKDATCQEDGTKDIWSCDHCGGRFLDEEGKTEATDENTVIPKSEEYHNIEAVTGKAATCKEDGIKDHWQCTVCQTRFLDKDGNTEADDDDLTIAKSEEYHDINHVEGKTATCKETGIKAHYKCSICKKLFLRKSDGSYVETDAVSLIIPVSEAGHKLETINGVAPTYYSEGKIKHQKCSICGELFDMDGEVLKEEDLVIPMANTMDDDKVKIHSDYVVEAGGVLDMNKLTGTQKYIELPVHDLKELAKDKDSLIIYTDDGMTIEFSDDALEKIVEDSDCCNTVTLYADVDSGTSNLNSTQKSALSGKKVMLSIELTMTCKHGNVADNFGKNEVAVTVSVTPESGYKLRNYYGLFINEKGSTEELKEDRSTSSNTITLYMSHFSDYVVVRDKKDASSPATGDAFNLVLWVSVAVVAAVVLIVVLILMRKSDKKNNKR